MGIRSTAGQYTFPKDGKVLIKTSKDEVINLVIANEQTLKFDHTKWDSTLKKYVDYYSEDFIFVISEDDLQRILNDGIIKLRVEITNSRYLECEKDITKKKEKKSVDKLTEWLNNGYKLLLDRISKPRADVSKGF